MATMRITIDGKTVMDGDIGQWTTNPPEMITDQLKAGAKPVPGIRALMLELAMCGASGQSLVVDLRTKARGKGFTLDVGYP